MTNKTSYVLNTNIMKLMNGRLSDNQLICGVGQVWSCVDSLWNLCKNRFVNVLNLQLYVL